MDELKRKSDWRWVIILALLFVVVTAGLILLAYQQSANMFNQLPDTF